MIQVYCDMKINGGGYIFVDSNYLQQLPAADAASMQFHMKDAVIRFLNHKGEQKYGVMSQLNAYK